MMGAKQMKFCGAVARALLIGVKFGELNGVRIGNGSKMGKLQGILIFFTRLGEAFLGARLIFQMPRISQNSAGLTTKSTGG